MTLHISNAKPILLTSSVSGRKLRGNQVTSREISGVYYATSRSILHGDPGLPVIDTESLLVR